MEDVMDSPIFGQFQLVSDWGNDGSYPEGSVPPWGQFLSVVGQFEIRSFEPDSISELVRFETGFSSCQVVLHFM